MNSGQILFFFFFLQRESRSLVPVREPEGRARDPARVTEPPALNQRDTRCVISHTNTHTHRERLTAQREARWGLYKESFSRKGNRGPKKCYSCGST